MSNPHLTTQFRKDVRLARRHGKDTSKLQEVIDAIARGEQLDQSYRPHLLSGDWDQSWECHIEPDWLLIWKDEGPGGIIFLRTGTHADLFKK